MTTSTPGPAGAFSYSYASDTWVWSEDVFRIHGFEPGEVVPTTELWLFHRHPEDRPRAETLLRTARDLGDVVWDWHRVLDARGRTRQVLLVGATHTTAYDGGGPVLRGHMVDITVAVRRRTAVEVGEAVQAITASRPVIEQAKGGLMGRFGVDAETAFELLRRYSQHTNVKVRDVAHAVVDAMASGRFADADATVWTQVHRDVASGELPPLGAMEGECG